MTCYENSEEEKYENGEEENKQESKNSDDERKLIPEQPGTLKNPLMQLYVSNVFTTGITSEWAMSTIEDKLATPRVLSAVQALIESSKHGQVERSQNMINVQLAREKSKIEHRSSNISHPCENVAHAQPSVSHKEDQIQNWNYEYGLSKLPREDPEEDDRKPAAKRIKKEPEDEAQSWLKKSR